MLTEKIRTAGITALFDSLTTDALIQSVNVTIINTAAGRRWRVAVAYDFGDGEIGTNSHGIPLYTNLRDASDAAGEVAEYISSELGGCKIPVFVPSLYDGIDD